MYAVTSIGASGGWKWTSRFHCLKVLRVAPPSPSTVVSIVSVLFLIGSVGIDKARAGDLDTRIEALQTNNARGEGDVIARIVRLRQFEKKRGANDRPLLCVFIARLGLCLMISYLSLIKLISGERM
jgi:hypothetical protein